MLEEYRSDLHDLASDLFVPCLSVSSSYDRAVGYFTSSGLNAAARGLEAFSAHDGVMRLIASPAFTDEDIQAIEKGYEAREDVVARVLLRSLILEVEPSVQRRLALLSLLIAEERLVIRIALPKEPRRGLFHEKVGIFRDVADDRVGISGSANETRGGLVENFEAVDVFTSWDSAASRVQRKERNFEALWEDATEGLEVLSFPDAVRQELLTRVPPQRVAGALEEDQEPVGVPIPISVPLKMPEGFELRSYQDDAKVAWGNHDHVGLLAMATGTGKTVTSISAVADLRAQIQSPLAIVVLAPYVHLVDQWANELGRWGVKPLRCYGSSASWVGSVQERIDLFQAGAIDVLCLVGTHSSAALKPLQTALSRLPGAQSVLIADEAHHLGSDSGLEALPHHFRYRLGLSATPERWEDPKGTERLLDYFGGVVFEFDISAAIAEGCLCKYEYLPELVDLDEEELDEYHRVTTMLVAELDKPAEKRSQKRVQQLLQERSAVLDSAVGKLERLREAVQASSPDRSLVYCANRKQLSAVMDLLWDRAIASRQFTGEEERTTRQEILREFENRTTPAIVAMRCLDEGVDIPMAREAYILASSGNPKEFVQRRGRLLRNAPGKSHALIHDYVVVPDGRNDREREILKREVRRVVEFANAASNRTKALDVIWPALQRNGLLYEVGR